MDSYYLVQCYYDGWFDISEKFSTMQEAFDFITKHKEQYKTDNKYRVLEMSIKVHNYG